MKTKSLSFAILLFVSIFYGCKKELDATLTETKSESNTASFIKFIYHDKAVSRSDFDTNNPDLVMMVEANNTVYVFDNNDDFTIWANTTSYADDITQLETQRQEILDFANAHGVIEEYNGTGQLKQEYIDFLESRKNTSSNKTNVLSALYDFAGAAPNSEYKVIVTGWPYGTLGKMNNRASSISGITVVTVCYDNSWFSGSRVYISSFGSTLDFSDISFDDRTSSVLSL